MKLSEMIARDAFWEEELEVPDKGHFAVTIQIQNGRITFASKEEKIKKEK